MIPTAAEQVTTAAAALQWPKGYPVDVQIDAANLDRLQPAAFAWYITADFGTYLILTAEMVEIVQNIARERTGKLYVYQRGHLRPTRNWTAAADALRNAPQKPEYAKIY